MTKSLRNTAAVLAGVALLGGSASASIVYDNTDNYQGSFANIGNTEAGDEIQLAGTDRLMTDFAFEYFITPSAAAHSTAELFIRDRTGAPNNTTPGSILYDSGPIALAGLQTALGFGQIAATGTAVQLPANGDVIWTVKFTGVDTSANEQAGLLYYNPPSVGSSFDDYWINGASGFQLVDSDGVVDNFGARLTAVPEPSTIALLLAGASAFGVARLRRKS